MRMLARHIGGDFGFASFRSFASESAKDEVRPFLIDDADTSYADAIDGITPSMTSISRRRLRR